MEAKRNKQIASVERNILVFFTVFASFVFIMSPIAVPGGVDLWVYFVVAISAILPWVAHVKKIRDYRYRALLTSGMMLVCLAIHGMYVSSFAIVAPTIAALTILLAIYGIREVVYQEMAVAVYILLYHIHLQSGLPPDSLSILESLLLDHTPNKIGYSFRSSEYSFHYTSSYYM